MADLFKTAGADRLMAVDLHTAQIQGFFDGPVDHLFALPLLADYVRKRVDRARLTVVSPDAGRVRVAERWTDRLGGARWRSSTSAATRACPTRSRCTRSSATSPGRTCMIVDDMIDTGGHDRARPPRRCCEHGAAEVIVAATHARALRPGGRPAEEQPRSPRSIVTNTLPIAEAQQFDKLTVLSIAPMIARAIREVFDDGSVTSLFEGNA